MEGEYPLGLAFSARLDYDELSIRKQKILIRYIENLDLCDVRKVYMGTSVPIWSGCKPIKSNGMIFTGHDRVSLPNMYLPT